MQNQILNLLGVRKLISILKGLLLISTCFFLTGCPPAKYYYFVPTSASTISEDQEYIIKVKEDLEYSIFARKYVGDNKSPEAGISVFFYSDDKKKISELKKLDLNIYSKQLGTLPEVSSIVVAPSIPYQLAQKFAVFRLGFSKKKFKDYTIYNDTIFVELNNRKILSLTRKSKNK